MSDIQDSIDSAIEELRQWAKDNPGDDPTYDGTLQELADGCVPVYNYDRLQAAMDNFDYAICVPELADGGNQSPLDLIGLNIYEDAEQQLHEAWSEIEQEIEDEEDLDDLTWDEIDPDEVYEVGLVPVTPIFRSNQIEWMPVAYWSDTFNEALSVNYPTVWEAVGGICKIAQELGIKKLELTWDIDEKKLREINDWRISKLIKQQNSRSTKVVKDDK